MEVDTMGLNLRYLEKHLFDLFLGTMNEFDQIIRQPHVCGCGRISRRGLTKTIVVKQTKFLSHVNAGHHFYF